MDNGLPTNEVYSCYETEDGLLYVAHDLGVSIYDGKEFKPAIIPGIKEGNSCFGIYMINNVLWFKFSDQLFYLKNGEFLPYKYNELLKAKEIGIVFQFTFDHDDLLLSTDKKAYKISSQGKFEEQNIKPAIVKIDTNIRNISRNINNSDSVKLQINNEITNINCFQSAYSYFGAEYNGNNIYWNGLTFYSFVSESQISKGVEYKLKLEDDALNMITSIQLVEERLFVSTIETGIQIFMLKNGKWEFQETLFDGNTTGIVNAGKSGLWVPLVRKGLAFVPNFHIRNYSFDKTIHQTGFFGKTPFIVEQVLIKNNPVHIITKNNQLVELDTFILTPERIKFGFNNPKVNGHKINNNICLMAGLVESNIPNELFATPFLKAFRKNGNLITISPYATSFYSQNNLNADTIYLKNTYDALYTDNETILVAGGYGLIELEILKGKWVIKRKIDLDKKIIKLEKIDNEFLFLTTPDEILNFDYSKWKIERTVYLEPHSQIKSSHYRNNLLFIGTKSFLKILDLKSTKTISLNYADGLASANISRIISNDSLMICNQEKGVSVIPISFILKKLNVPPVDYNEKLVWNQSSDQLNFTLNLSELSPYITYRKQYRINNKDYVDFAEKSFQFSNLKAGSYEMNIRFRISNGDWVELNPIHFEIPSPFYSRWWFSASIVAFIALIIILIIKRRNQIKTKRLETEKLIETLRMNALTSQMNPQFLYNALNTIQGLLTGDTKQVFIYVSDLARFFRLMLNNSSEMFIPIHREIQLNEIFSEIESVRQHKKVELVIQYDKNELGDFLIPSMVLQPFVENALWHAFTKEIQHPKIKIFVSELDDFTLKIEITDNGVGILNTKNKTKFHQSKGVSIVENRLKIFNSDNPSISKNIILTDRTEIDPNTTGTKVEVYLTKHEEYEFQSLDH
ncbi:MAG: histidine kinase [Crocinitomicaceae bacterium]